METSKSRLDSLLTHVDRSLSNSRVLLAWIIESNSTLLMAVNFLAHSRQVISKSWLIDGYKSTMSKTTNVRESLSGKLLNHFIMLAVFVH